MVNVQKTVQSSVFGGLLTVAIAIITWGFNSLQTNTEEWYIGLAAMVIGAVLIIIDTYVLKTQENC